MLLPGQKAAEFRRTLADVFIRVMGGDLTLADEIKEISEFHDTLPENHPLRAFKAAPAVIGRSSSSITPSTPVGIDAVQSIVSPIILELQKLHNQSLDHMRDEFLQHSQRLRQEDREARRIDYEKLSERIGLLEHGEGTQQTQQPQAVNSQIESTSNTIATSSNHGQTSPASVDPFAQFLRHFFSLSHTSRKIDVESLMRKYTAFATEHALPLIETRHKLLLNVSRVSVRLRPVKASGRIVGWSWI